MRKLLFISVLFAAMSCTNTVSTPVESNDENIDTIVVDSVVVDSVVVDSLMLS